MKKETAEVLFDVTPEQLDDIRGWLIEEENNKKEGFYCNWKLIKQAFERKNFAAILIKGNAMGFATWRKTSLLTVTIDIVEIMPRYRKKAYGELLITKVLESFKTDGIYAVDLQCEPRESKSFWNSLGFIDVPKNIRYWHFSREYVYKIPVPALLPSDCSREDEFLELWEDEPIMTIGKSSKWQWKPEYDLESQELKLPIIHPCEKDWRVRWVKEGVTKIDDKMKRFGDDEIDFGAFIILSKVSIK